MRTIYSAIFVLVIIVFLMTGMTLMASRGEPDNPLAFLDRYLPGQPMPDAVCHSVDYYMLNHTSPPMWSCRIEGRYGCRALNVMGEGGFITNVYAIDCDIQLGDVMMIYGRPTRVQPSRFFSILLWDNGVRTVTRPPFLAAHDPFNEVWSLGIVLYPGN